jgi:hypothetical protein
MYDALRILYILVVTSGAQSFLFCNHNVYLIIFVYVLWIYSLRLVLLSVKIYFRCLGKLCILMLFAQRVSLIHI